jgi:hypothetical protein
MITIILITIITHPALWLVEETEQYNYPVGYAWHSTGQPICEQHIPVSMLTTQQEYIQPEREGFTTLHKPRYIASHVTRYGMPAPEFKSVIESRPIYPDDITHYGGVKLKSYPVEHYEAVILSSASLMGKGYIKTSYPTYIRRKAYIRYDARMSGGSIVIQGTRYTMQTGTQGQIPIVYTNTVTNKSRYRETGEYIAIQQAQPTNIPVYRQGTSSRQVYAHAQVEYSDLVPVWIQEIVYDDEFIQIGW